MTKFHHPYNFISVTGKIGKASSAKTKFDDVKDGKTQARHDLWMLNTESGRIVCRLRLDTPTVVGAEQIKETRFDSKRVEPYLRNNQPAIPANSLRGMIGSIAETLSQSALRVLENEEYKVSYYDRELQERVKKRHAGHTHDYFNENLRPWNAARHVLTPAELLLGVVEESNDTSAKEKTEEEGNERPARNLASRLRFSDALPILGANPPLGREVTLKILASPKLPCPAMYFHRGDGSGHFISKKGFAIHNQANPRPNGRKVYLHHPKEIIKEEAWITRYPYDHTDQKLRCTPLEAGQDFYFHIDFENLSEAEVGLVLTSLRPSGEFRHRLGLGKPLGLGTVEVAIEGVFLVNRIARYGLDALNQPRYHAVWRKESPPKEIAWAAGFYSEEAHRLTETENEGKLTWPKSDMTLVDTETLKILQTVGDPGNLEESVQPPLLDVQDPEQETFLWFQENESAANPQALKPIQAGGKLPTLNT
ncbi:MAG: RAMP superfamily CRISPR-associated protein [Gammaproteobacteria bacterium]